MLRKFKKTLRRPKRPKTSLVKHTRLMEKIQRKIEILSKLLGIPSVLESSQKKDQSDAIDMDAVDPDAVYPTAVNSEAPSTINPDVVNPDVNNADVVNPDMASPNSANLDAVSLGRSQFYCYAIESIH